jgi:hypothetical protein
VLDEWAVAFKYIWPNLLSKNTAIPFEDTLGPERLLVSTIASTPRAANTI